MRIEPQNNFSEWLGRLPKAELHLHIDGSLQAHRLLSLAKKNDIALPYSTQEQIEDAYHFEDLQSFLDLYYLGASVLVDESDFYHLMMDYLLKCKEQNIVHAEIMVEPQTYAPNGVSFATMMQGFNKAIEQAKQEWGQSVSLILSFLRHLDVDQCLETLEQAKAFKQSFVAIGLASAEQENPPIKFERLYQEAHKQGYRATAHAGEEGPAAFIWDCLNVLNVERIDHGVRCLEDPKLVDHLIAQQIPLTVCPLSNTKLCVFEKMSQHNVLDLLNQGVLVTINSDDPAYFGGYLNENFSALHEHLSLTAEQALELIENSFKASFLSDDDKTRYLGQLSRVAKAC